MMMKALFAAILCLCLTALPSAARAEEWKTKAGNPAANLVTAAQRASVASLRDIDGGLFYTMDYSADYKLDDILKANVDDVKSCIDFVRNSLLNGGNMSAGLPDAGCSAFTVRTPEGAVLCGRNFDYKMDMTAVLLRTAPKGGYRSIGMVDAGWVGYGIGSLSNGRSDLSMAVSFPYLTMDGMNEKGLTVSVLKLDGEPARQEGGKPRIMTTVAIRLMLDRAADIDEALALLRNYDMYSPMPDANFHFLLSDASGRSAVLEYSNNKMVALDENYATNFYLDPEMKALGHGKERYEILKSVLDFKKNIMTEGEAMALLSLVSQPETEASTSMTQWSALYDLTALELTVAIRRNYEKLFHFSIDDKDGAAAELKSR